MRALAELPVAGTTLVVFIKPPQLTQNLYDLS